MGDRALQERRKQPRYPAILNVSFVFSRGRRQGLGDRRISGKGRNISGRTGNVSFEGLLIRANPSHADVLAFFQGKGAEDPLFPVDLEVELDGRTIRVEGQVRWFKLWYTGEKPYQLEAGVFVRRMSPEARGAWDRYFKGLGP